jgi:uncharacterized membrane protein
MRAVWYSVVACLLLAGCGGGGRGTNDALPPAAPTNSNSLAAPSSVTPPHYTVTDLGSNVLPAHINDVGAIVGTVTDPTTGVGTAFIWQSGTHQNLLPLPGYPNSEAKWINNTGEVVGTSLDPAKGLYRATEFVPGGSDIDLGAPGGEYSFAYSVNDRGEVVGSAQYSNMPLSQVATFTGVNSATAIPNLGGRGLAINDAGDIVGGMCCPYGFPDTNTSAFEYPPLTVFQMPADSGEGATAADINSSGDIVGYYNTGQTRYSTQCCGFYIHAGKVTELDGPGGAAGFLAANALNDSDWIVGEFSPAPTKTEAFLYINSVVDLNTLIPEDCGWVLQNATSINNRGQIVGVGVVNGVAHGFLLTPH